MEKLGVMEVDVVTQLLTELDKAAIFFRIGAGGVWVVEGVASSIRGILVRLVMCVMVGHRKLKIEIIKLLTILC